jgi:hypothetical protein
MAIYEQKKRHGFHGFLGFNGEFMGGPLARIDRVNGGRELRSLPPFTLSILQRKALPPMNQSVKSVAFFSALLCE